MAAIAALRVGAEIRTYLEFPLEFVIVKVVVLPFAVEIVLRMESALNIPKRKSNDTDIDLSAKLHGLSA